MTYKYTPEIHSDKQTQIDHAVKGENENKEMIGNRLKIAVDRMERVRSKRRWD